IWTSPSVDPATNTIYVTTGTKNQPTQTLAQSMLAFDATTLAIKGGWEIPEADAVVDSDWGATPTLYDDAQGRHWAVASNKDGYLYAFDRTNVTGGPVWRSHISIGGACPTCGDGSIASTAFANNTVFVAGGNATLANGQGYPGAVRALDPATGNVLWERGDQGPVVPAVTWVNGLVIAEPGNTVEVLDATTGARLWSYATGAPIYAAASVAEGAIFTGSVDGNVYAFAPGNPVVPPADGACPATWTCQDVGAPSPAGNEGVAGGTWTVSAGGSGLAPSGSDQIRLLTQAANGAAQVTAQLTSVTAGSAGVMLRQSNLPGAPFYAVAATAGGGISVASRSVFGGAISTVNRAGTLPFPFTLRAMRVGDSFSAATSPDGTTFTLVPGGTVNLMLPTATLAGIWSASGTAGVAASAVFANPTVAAPGTPPAAQASPSACPATWTCGDIGDPLTVGDQALAGGVWTVKGAGADINSYADQFHYVWQTVAADATLSAHVTAQTNTNGSAKAGLMVRQSSDAGAAFYGLFATPGTGLQVIYRTGLGLRTAQIPVSGTVPAYLQIQRSGNTFTAWTSTNGTNWTYVPGTNVTLDTNGGMLAGLAVTSRNGGTLSVVTLDSVALTQSAPAAPVSCPTNWTCQDIGFPLPTGSQSANANLNAWSVIAGGSDIYGGADQFRLVAENMPGDGTFSARVLTQDNTNDWAKAGVMIRASTDAGSPYFGMFIAPGHGVVVQWRSVQGGGTVQVKTSTTVAAYPTFMQVGRVGNTFTAYTSPDGGTWTAVPGATTTITMPGVALAGMAVTSHNNGNQGVVNYDKVVLVATCLTGWNCTDIGDGVAIAGGNTLVNNVWSVYGGGTDIWATADQFHYLWQVQSGDGSISAQVTAQANTDPNAKAGLMLRQSVDPAAPYYAVYLTPGSGVVVQYRTASGQFSGQAATVAGTAPVYLKLTRNGFNYTAFTSTNGTTWTLIPGSSVNLTVGGPFLAGLAVTGHNAGLLGAATFAAVSLNAPAPPTCPAGWT
ncbi:MAG: PQQ-binding-like beta-propeller repeat protein, partial [Ktedonobacterales bacterium]|nr:PQQ-binding-like beta-propeller repeat protein [Ktedonobacterales bacterium]